MKLPILLLFLILLNYGSTYSQKNIDKLPYRKMPKYSEDINYGFVMSRIIDELGYTYYWASEGLNKEDFVNEYGSKNILYALLENIDQVSYIIASLTLNDSISDNVYVEKSLNELRKKMLFNLINASNKLYLTEDSANLPLWGILSKPISDVKWYTDQIISYR